MYESSAMDTAARFGEIPFAAFTKDLVMSTFEGIVDCNIKQMHAYTDMVKELSVDLTTYINNTVDSVEFSEITDFVKNLNLPSADEANNLLKTLSDGYNYNNAISTGTAAPAAASGQTEISTNTTAAILNAATPIVKGILEKIKGQDGKIALANTQAIANIQETFIKKAGTTLPNYNILYQSIASTIASNKYAILQNMAKLGLLRLVVSDGEIETKITFSTWEEHSDSKDTYHKDREVNSTNGMNMNGVPFWRRNFTATRNRSVTVNTAKTHHRDTSGTKVDIFGRVLVRFKTDYLPLNV